MASSPLSLDLSVIPDLESARLLIQKQAALIERYEKEGRWKDVKIDALTFELSRYKRWKFNARTEALTTLQRSLFEESLDEDILAIEARLEELQAAVPTLHAKRSTPKRQSFPEQLERIEHRHEPESCQCTTCGSALKKIGEDISERLDCRPIEFFVHRHVRSKYSCPECETMTAAAMPAQIIEKGQPAPGLLAQVLVERPP